MQQFVYSPPRGPSRFPIFSIPKSGGGIYLWVSQGYTPVHAAAAWGRVEILGSLLKRAPAAANVVDEDGDTPLHHLADATELGKKELQGVVDLLLASHADPTLKNGEGKTCLDVAL